VRVEDVIKVLTSEEYDTEFVKFGRVKEPLHKRRDLCALLYLDKLVPHTIIGGEKMIIAADHDHLFLSVTVKELAAVAKEPDLLYLTRCGVLYSKEHGCLIMYA
jgi:hypothetical protein